MGTMSGFGWDTFSMLCPLGALGTMIATKTMIPRAVVSLVLIAALVLVFGRAFCSWLCPTMLIDRIRDFFRSPKKRRELTEKKNSEIKAISQQELASLKAAKDGYACGACGKCQPVHHGKVDSRHAVLGGALLSTAVFGFPVFCLVCPVGLTFATVLVIWRAFAHGDRDHRAHSHSGHARHRTGGAAEMVLQLLPAFGPHEPGRALLAHVCAYH